MNHLQPNKRIEKLIRPIILGPLLIALGFIGLYFSTIIRNPYTILYPSALIVGPLVFYGISKHQGGVAEVSSGETYLKVVLLCFFLVLSALTVQYHSVGFNRTSSVFYLTFLLYLLAGLYILGRPRPAFALSVILIAGLANRLTAYYNSVLYSGVDIYSHSRWVEAIAADGSLEVFAANKHFYAPFYHILAAGGELVYSVPTRDAIALTTLLAVTTIPVLVVYLITTHFWNTQIGLVAGLLYITADHAINWGIHVIPTSLGLVFFALLLLALIRYAVWRKKIQYSFVVLFLIILTFTHQVSLFIGITATGALALAIVFYKLKASKAAINIGLVAGLITFGDFVVTKYQGPEGDASFFDVVLGGLVLSLLEAGTAARPEVFFPQDPSISPTGAAGLTLVQVAGSTALLVLAIVGALHWLSNSRSDSGLLVGISLSVAVTILLTVTLAGPVVGLGNLLPGRWWAFTYLLLAILAAPGLIILIKASIGLLQIKTERPIFIFAMVLFVAILLPYLVLMGGNWAGAGDKPLLNDAPVAESAQISETEKQLFEHAVKYEGEIDIVADRRASPVFSRYYDTSVRTLSITYNEPESLHHPSLIIDRDYIHTQHAQYYIRIDGQRLTVHGAFPLQEIPNALKQTTYDNGNHGVRYYIGSAESE